MNLNATNHFSADQILFSEGEKTGYICFVLKGKLKLYNRGISILVGPGTLLGANPGSEEISSYSCQACEDVSVYAFAADQKDGLASVLASNKDYNGVSVYSMIRIVQELIKQYKRLKEYTALVYKELKLFYKEYLDLAKSAQCSANMMPEISQLAEYVPGVEIEEDKLIKALEYGRIPYEAIKSFYTGNRMLTLDVLTELSHLKERLIEIDIDMSDYLYNGFNIMVGNETNSLYRNVLCLGFDMKAAGKSTDTLEKLADKCFNYLAKAKKVCMLSSGRQWTVIDEHIVALGEAFLDGRDFRGEGESAATAVSADIATDLESLNDSYNQILKFAMYSGDKAAKLGELFEAFCQMSDKESVEDEYRKLRRSLAEAFYDLYYNVFMQTLGAPRIPKAVELFLNYGYLSEKLLKDDQLTALVSAKHSAGERVCNVHTMFEWLQLIQRGEREPSRNDMGQDYAEYLRELKKEGKINQAQEQDLLKDGNKKVEYEIKDVLAHGNRVVNGQLSTFVPILHSEMFIGDPLKAFNTADKISDTVKDLVSIDFSVFYREMLFIDPAGKIERETEMKEVYPEFILYPTVGTNVIMWQEISGRKRDSQGRFFAPAFSFTALKDMMIKSFGHFRWALCKTIQGTNWNNIQIHSLTSEYSDYIQFYKKNKDLSDERKEKVKLQIQRGRNNLREVFALDYEVWMKNEVNGAVKLNKVARDILAMYCPFSVDIRTKLTKQPLYDEAYARSNRERGKKIHELELRYRSFESKGIVLPEALSKTLIYYRDL